jgi:hypothetical protein
MRYYDIIITPLNGKQQIVFNTLGSAGTSNGSALRVDFEIFQQQFNQSGLNSFIRVYGLSYKQINQIADLNPRFPLNIEDNYARIQISAGMSKGLPFAKPDQQGILVKGLIGQAFANWQGTEISLDLVIIPSMGTNVNPVNIPFSWKKGNTLESAVRASLGIAFPTTKISGSYSPSLIFTEDQAGYYYDLEELATYVYNQSKVINSSPTYIGAMITKTSDGFLLEDGTATKTSSKQIKFTDIIGNLTWLDVSTIQAKLVMRGDLAINQIVKFPKGSPITNIVNSFSQYRNNVSFQGEFQISKIHHLGYSRQPSADNWVTIIDCKTPVAAA